jgi:nucleotide-binding universal stress UspA family protein
MEILEVYKPEMLWGPKDAERAQQALAEVEKMHKDLADRYLSVIEKMANEAGVPFEGVFIDREAPEEGIIKIAERKGCDLIFIASHSTVGTLAGSLLGGVTTKVVAHSKIPVLIHRC